MRQIAHRAYIKYVPRIGRRPAPMDVDFLRHLGVHDVLVARLDTMDAGFLIGFARETDYFIENIAVDPIQAGAGIGSALMTAAEGRALAADRHRIVLYTNVRMHENFPFYARRGYLITHETREAGFRRVYFEKDIQS